MNHWYHSILCISIYIMYTNGWTMATLIDRFWYSPLRLQFMHSIFFQILLLICCWRVWNCRSSRQHIFVHFCIINSAKELNEYGLNEANSYSKDGILKYCILRNKSLRYLSSIELFLSIFISHHDQICHILYNPFIILLYFN